MSIALSLMHSVVLGVITWESAERTWNCADSEKARMDCSAAMIQLREGVEEVSAGVNTSIGSESRTVTLVS